MRYFLYLIFIIASLHANETLTLYGNQYKPPKIWTQDDKNQGILVEVVKEVSKHLDVKFHIQTYPWARAYKMASKAKGGIIGISLNEHRKKIFDFNSVPLFLDTIVIVTKKGKEFKFEKLEDLKDKKIGYCRSCSFGKVFEEAKKHFIPVETDDSREQRLQLLLNGKIDAALLGPGSYALKTLCEKNSAFDYEDFTILAKPLVVDANYIAFSKELHKKEFLEKFDKILQEKIDDKTVETIINNFMDIN